VATVERPSELAYTDELTGLSNRRYLNQRLASQVREAASSGRPLSLFVLDVDYFKDINDSHGHLAGDETLTKIAGLLKSTVRDADTVYRYAGDEFAVILPDTDNGTALRIAQNIASRVSGDALEVLGKPINATVSIGVATFPEDGQDETALFGFADRALYARKRRGRNGVCSRKEVAKASDPLRPRFCPELVGRRTELGTLRELLNRSFEGRGGLVLLSGEAGVGKSRLLNEFAESARRRGALVLSGRCFGEPTCLPYQPFKEALSKYAVGGNGGRAEMFKALPDVYRNELLALIPELVALGVEKGAAIDLPGDRARLRLFDAIRTSIVKISKEKPLVLLLDDLHSADDSSSQLLHYLVRNLQDSGVLICGAFRGEELEVLKDRGKPLAKALNSMSRDGLFSSIRLGRLSRPETARMTALILDTEHVPSAFSRRMYEETEGNPFFVEEVLKSLIDSGKVGFTSDLDKVDLDGLEIPEAIRQVIQGRLDMLDVETRGILTLAAVIGQAFPFEVLLPLSETNEGHLLDLMEQGLRSQLIVEEGEEGYRFSHGKINETIYDGIAKRRRRRLHRIVGETLEEVYGKEAEELAGDLSRHFHLAGEWKKSFEYSYRAGKKARSLYANDDALRSYRRALDVFRRLGLEEQKLFIPTITDLQEEVGGVLTLLGRYDDALISHEATLRIAKSFGTREAQGKALNSIGAVHMAKGSYDEALMRFEESLAIRKELGLKNDVADSLHNVGMIHNSRGRQDEALRCYHEALEIRKETRDRSGLARDLNSIGIIHRERGSYEEALRYYEESLATSREIDERTSIATALHNIGVIHNHRCAYDEAFKYYREALTTKREIGDRRGIASSLHNIGVAHLDRRSYGEALRCYEESLAIRTEIGDKRGIGYSLSEMGRLYWMKGSRKEALRYYEKSLTIRREIGDKRGIADVLYSIGLIRAHGGAYDEALARFEESVAMRREIGDKRGIGYSLNGVALVCGERGCFDVALSSLEESLAAFSELQDKVGIAHSLHNIGASKHQKASYDEALKHYEDSLRVFRELGDKTGVAWCLGDIGLVHEDMGSYDDSLRFYEDSLAMYRELGHKPCVTNRLLNIRNIRRIRGSRDKALNLCDESMPIAKETVDVDVETNIFALLAKIHIGLGRREEARAAIDGLLGIAELTKSSRYLAEAHLLTACLLSPSEGALPHAEKALELSEKMKTPESIWRARQIIGKILKERGDLTDAREHFRKAKDIIESIALGIGDAENRKTYLNKSEHKELFAECKEPTDKRKGKRKKMPKS
jgi:diguanylate cyclase (GGDEF)-like protein